MAAARIDWAQLATKFPQSATALTAFRARHAELSRQLQSLKEQQISIDFSQYKLANSKVIAEATKAVGSFKPAEMDLTKQLQVIEENRSNALAQCSLTSQKIDLEMDELKEMLKNIDTARPIDQMTVRDVSIAYPELDQVVEKMVRRGQWRVPGYYEK